MHSCTLEKNPVCHTSFLQAVSFLGCNDTQWLKRTNKTYLYLIFSSTSSGGSCVTKLTSSSICSGRITLQDKKEISIELGNKIVFVCFPLVKQILKYCEAYFRFTGELRYDGPLYNGFLNMTDDMLGPSPMHIKYSSYVYDGFCI